MTPLMIQLPERILTPRLILRSPTGADGPAVNAAVCESIDALRFRTPWAQTEPTLAQSESDCRRMQARFLLREDLALMMFRRGADDREVGFIGGTGLHRIQWPLRRFEIGYWCRTGESGQGYVTEAVQALAGFAFDQLEARRVEIRIDPLNPRSCRVAERAGFTLEGVHRCDSATPDGTPRDTCVYALVRRRQADGAVAGS